MTSHSSHTSFQFVVTLKLLKVKLSKVAVAFQITLLCQKDFKYRNYTLFFCSLISLLCNAIDVHAYFSITELTYCSFIN